MNAFSNRFKKAVFFAVVFQFAAQASAQMMAVPMRQTIQTPYGSVPITTYHHMHMPMYTGTTAPVSNKYDFTLVLKDKSVVTERVRINTKDSIDHIVIKDGRGRKADTTVYTPSETLEIFRVLPTGHRLKGIPADSCWLFPASKGKISTYSRFAETKMEWATAIQKGDGPIVALTASNLREMVVDNERALKFVEKKDFDRAIWTYNKD